MYVFIGILMLIAGIIVFFKCSVLRGYSLQKAAYYTVSTLGSVVALLYLNRFVGFIFTNRLTAILCATPFVALMLYCERYIIKSKSSEQESLGLGSQDPLTQAQTPAQHKTESQQEYEEWKQDIERRKALHAMVPLTQIESVIQELSFRTKRPVIWIEPQDAEGLSLFASKYGGLPYVPDDGRPPCDAEGRQLRFLAQLNLWELPRMDVLPREGILQFWALNDRMYGFAPYHNNENGTYRVVYHHEVDHTVSVEQVLQKYDPWYEVGLEGHFPIRHEYALSFTLGEESMGSDDSRWEAHLAELWNQRYPDMKIDYLEDLPNALDKSEYQPYNERNKVGGYPNFVQSEQHGDEDVLLLQIPASGQGERRIVWGDSGIANFFIKEEALAMRDFSDVMYHWDCC